MGYFFKASVGRISHGQAMLETALAFPLLVLTALGLVQFAMYVHAENVVIGAVQDGARVAASADRTATDGTSVTETILRAGLGERASAIAVQGSDDGVEVTITATGSLTTILPVGTNVTLPLKARASVSKERFVVGPGG